MLLIKLSVITASHCLSDVLKRETAPVFSAPIGIMIYQHVAIAVSRRLLKVGGFKRDYDLRSNASNKQACHNPWTARRLYACELEEALGHVEAKRLQYRLVSQEWHALLGFSTALGMLREPLTTLQRTDS
jgi:hypothetical protein